MRSSSMMMTFGLDLDGEHCSRAALCSVMVSSLDENAANALTSAAEFS